MVALQFIPSLSGRPLPHSPALAISWHAVYEQVVHGCVWVPDSNCFVYIPIGGVLDHLYLVYWGSTKLF